MVGLPSSLGSSVVDLGRYIMDLLCPPSLPPSHATNECWLNGFSHHPSALCDSVVCNAIIAMDGCRLVRTLREEASIVGWSAGTLGDDGLLCHGIPISATVQYATVITTCDYHL